MTNFKKIFIIVISIILLVLIGILIFNYIKVLKIMDLKEKVAKYKEHNNFLISKEANEDEKISTVKIYFKDGKSLIEVISDEENTKRYYDDGTLYTYIEKDGKTEFNEGKVKFTPVNPEDPFDMIDSKKQAFVSSFKIKISNVTEKEKECYKIESSSTMINFDELYVEKETGLLIKSVIGNNIIEYTYEFDNVDDKIFERPKLNN